MIVLAGAGGRRAAVRIGGSLCPYSAESRLEASLPSSPSAKSFAKRISVEIARNAGSMMPWSCLSVELRAYPTNSLRLVVPHTGSTRLAGIECQGLLGRRMVLGLPLEFAQGVLDEWMSLTAPVSGSLTVIGSAYDPVNSARNSYREAARLAMWVAVEIHEGNEIQQDRLSSFLVSAF